MNALETGQEPRRGGAGRTLGLALAGVTAAAWLWNRREEDALRARTEARLRPFSARTGT